MTAHPTPLTLDRYHVDELHAAERDRAAEHIAGCDHCSAYLRELDAEVSAVLVKFPKQAFMAKLTNRRGLKLRRHRLMAMALFIPALASAWFFWMRPKPSTKDASSAVAMADLQAVRFKGGSLQVHRKRGERVEAIVDGGIRAGDALKVTISLSQAKGPLAIWFVDRAGRIDTFAAPGDVMPAPGDNHIPASAIVEEPCQDMWIVAAVGDHVGGIAQELANKADMFADVTPGDTRLMPAHTMSMFLECE